MMNDTTNINLNDLPITMEEDEAMQALEKAKQDDTQTNETPVPLQDFAFMAGIVKVLNNYIETLVDQRFAALVESHKTLALMDESMRDAITEMIDDRVCAHEDSHEHKNDDDIESEVSNHVEYFLRQGDHQFITERELSEKVSDVLDEILEERLNAALSNATIDISI